MKQIKRIIKTIKKIIRSKYYRAKFIYTNFYEKLSIKNNQIIIQSYEGDSISGNPYYILKELYSNKEYEDFSFFITVKNNTKKTIRKFLKNKGMTKNIKFIKLHSRLYCQKIAEAKYLVNNSTFPTYFIKKEGQKYINTWHGTPLKTLGRSIKSSPNEIGNTQRNFLMADYLLYPNKFTFKKMKQDYMLDNLFYGRYLITGYPRNDIFFDEISKNRIKKDLNITDKKIVVYMPTWRGQLNSIDMEEQINFTVECLNKIDKKLKSNTIMYVKLHNYISAKLDFKKFDNIKEFPKNYETYEFLSVADCLVTDYSSVFFDFANTNKKILLFTYDKEEYLKERGLYLNLEKLPFKQITDIDELIENINNNDCIGQYEDFKGEYCNYDNINSTKELCEYIFKNKKTTNIEVVSGRRFYNNKKKVLIFAGALQKNGITSALKGLVNNIDLEKRDYYLLFYKNKVEGNKYLINEFDKKLSYLVIQGSKNMTLREAIGLCAYFKLKICTNWTNKILDKVYIREIKRLFQEIDFDYVIHFSGYEGQIMELFSKMNSCKMLYTHNNMIEEEKKKKNFNSNSLKKCYKTYDRIVTIRESMKEEILEYMPQIEKEKIYLAHNLNNIEEIKNKAKKKIEFDNDTYCNYKLDLLKLIMENPNLTKFITIARYSFEKGLDRLILAFSKYQKNNSKTYLIIIGGYGKEFVNIRNLVLENKINNVIIIKSLSNPYPILIKSDLFILASYYEGLPMTIMESLILEKPIISTNITGPREFLQQGYGYLVENSTNGLENGMQIYKETGLSFLKKFDANEFNSIALKEFEELFNDK